MVRNKIILAAVGTIATAGLLLSFTGGDDEVKMKRYQVWHQKDGQKIEFDTLIPADSELTVNDFLATRGISEENVRIIDMTQPHPRGHRHPGHPEKNKSVEIKVELDENGNKTITKIEDGVTQTMTEAEFNEWESKQPKRGHREMHKMRRHAGDEGMEFMLSEEGEQVEIKLVVDEDGNVQTKKWVNGEEVEMTEEELKEFENAEGGKKVIFIDTHEEMFSGDSGEGADDVDIQIEIDSDGNKVITKTENGVTSTITEEELEEMDKKAKGKAVRIIEMEGENSWTPKDGTGKNELVEIKVTKDENGNLIKTKTVNGEEVPFTEEELKRIEEHAKRGGKMMRHERRHGEMRREGKERTKVIERIEHRIITTDSDEDYTIVLVENGLNKSEAQAGRTANEGNLKVYPNPNEGVFTVSFDQREKGNVSIEILDLNGKSLYQEELKDFSGSYRKEIDLSKFGAGTYLVNLRKGDQLTSNKIVVE